MYQKTKTPNRRMLFDTLRKWIHQITCSPSHHDNRREIDMELAAGRFSCFFLCKRCANYSRTNPRMDRVTYWPASTPLWTVRDHTIYNVCCSIARLNPRQYTCKIKLFDLESLDARRLQSNRYSSSVSIWQCVDERHSRRHRTRQK